MSFLIIPTCDLFYKIVMKVKRVLLSGTLLLSLLFSFALGTEEGKIEDFEYDTDNEMDFFDDGDVVLEDAQYDYEEVVGEETSSTVIPFKKYPGVYLIDLEGVLYALDADNGKILWARKVSDKLMRVTEAPPPPEQYGTVGNTTSLQRKFVISFSHE